MYRKQIPMRVVRRGCPEGLSGTTLGGCMGCPGGCPENCSFQRNGAGMLEKTVFFFNLLIEKHRLQACIVYCNAVKYNTFLAKLDSISVAPDIFLVVTL